jgi:DNA-binding PadR family transcriptional regulator
MPHMNDPEIDAMLRVATALSELEPDQCERVLRWATAKFGSGSVGSHSVTSTTPALERPDSTFETLAEFFDAVEPSLEREKALTTAYWLQFVEGQSEFSAQDINSRLKDLGHGIGNITEAFYQLQEERPALVLQLRKGGSSRQARKTYKVTDAGRKAVEAFFNVDRENP